MKKNTTILIVASFIVTLFSALLFGQTVEVKPVELNRSLRFNLVNGYAVAHQKNSTIRNSYRIQLNLNISISSGEENGNSNNTSDSNQHQDYYTNHYKNRSASVSLEFEKIFLSKVTPDFFLVWGAGPIVGYSRSSYTSNYSRESQDTRYTDDSDNHYYQFSGGLVGVAGCEARLSKSVGVYAEYNLYLLKKWTTRHESYSSVSQDSEYRSKGNYDGEGWQFSLSNVRLGIGFYF
jgi:hypothetical protein